ncbi:hypothetical protein GPJ56_005467 [Histomonas meleagridis]|uniref:uncharacterized protein n=1 Tax=Histomonas meleagridis TaxID=135588 RepID=UPI003559FA3A|nr:hypothetical protein GPJ56_005467 [Histomonas meleagridis]KAH0802491.1 hypothetical protein GO595_004540 [Histomonas meleagridis]
MTDSSISFTDDTTTSKTETQNESEQKQSQNENDNIQIDEKSSNKEIVKPTLVLTNSSDSNEQKASNESTTNDLRDCLNSEIEQEEKSTKTSSENNVKILDEEVISNTNSSNKEKASQQNEAQLNLKEKSSNSDENPNHLIIKEQVESESDSSFGFSISDESSFDENLDENVSEKITQSFEIHDKTTLNPNQQENLFNSVVTLQSDTSNIQNSESFNLKESKSPNSEVYNPMVANKPNNLAITPPRLVSTSQVIPKNKSQDESNESVPKYRVSFVQEFVKPRKIDSPMPIIPKKRQQLKTSFNESEIQMIDDYLKAAHETDVEDYHMLSKRDEIVLCRILPKAKDLSQNEVYDLISTELNVSKNDLSAHYIFANISTFFGNQSKTLNPMLKTSKLDFSSFVEKEEEESGDSDQYF